MKQIRSIDWPVWGIGLLALALRVWQLGAAQLWYDESFTLLVARLDIPRLVQATAGDVHPPLWYLIEWGMIRLLGATPWALRLPSLVASVLSILAAWRLALQLPISRPALLGVLAFLAINSTQIWYAQEARMYALLELLVILQILFLLQRRWVRLGLVNLAIIYLHNYALFYLAVIGLAGLWLAWRRADRRVWPLVLSIGLPVVAWLPWAAALYLQMSQVAAGYWIQTFRFGTVIYCLQAIWVGFAINPPFDALAPLVFFGALALTIYRALQNRRFGLLLWLGLAPLGLVVLVSLVWHPVLLFRGLIGAVVPLAFAIGETLLGAHQPRLYRAVAVALVLPVLLAGLVTIQSKYGQKGSDSNIFQKNVSPYWQAGDVMLHVNDGSAVTGKVYAAGPQFELQTNCPDPLGSLSPLTRQALGFERLTFEDAISQYQRVWLVGGVGSTSSACEERYMRELVSQADRTQYYEPSDFTYVGVWIYDRTRFTESRGDR